MQIKLIFTRKVLHSAKSSWLSLISKVSIKLGNGPYEAKKKLDKLSLQLHNMVGFSWTHYKCLTEF